MKNNRILRYRWLVVLPLILLLASNLTMLAGTDAVFRSGSTAENYLYSSLFKVDLIDIFDSGRFSYPGDTLDKNVAMKNNGEINAVVRIRLTPSWTPALDALDNPLDVNVVSVIFGEPVDIDGNPLNWTLLDGWYYYNLILKPGEQSTLLVDALVLGAYSNDHHDVDYSGAVYTLDVESESLQAIPAAAQENWSVTFSPGNEGVLAWSVFGGVIE